MVPWLYLDTARLGQMSPAAQRASRDFVGFAGEVAAAIQFDRFLQHGLEACPAAIQLRYPGLVDWKGIGGLKGSLSHVARVEPGLPVLLGGRSAQLMKFAAMLLCRLCENILVTDLGWPDYHRLLAVECRRANRRLTVVPLCDDLLCHQLDEDGVVKRIHSEYVRHRCDGLFLTAVNNLGVYLPIQRISRQIEQSYDPRFVVVDGAQDFCHVTSDLSNNCCDLYLTGCHKWLGAYYPLGLAFYGRRRSRGIIETALGEVIEAREVDDPLLRLVEQLASDAASCWDETVNLSALFACQGAVSDVLRTGAIGSNNSAARIQNAQQVAQAATAAGWSPRRPHPALRTGVLLLQAEREKTRRQPPDQLRSAFHDHGITLTTYADGLVRLSMPAEPMQPHELGLVSAALRSVA